MDTVIVFILEDRNTEAHEGQFAHHHTASKWQRWEPNPGGQAPESVLLPIKLICYSAMFNTALLPKQ